MSYLAKTTSKGHEYFKIMESYRENGKVKHRVIYNIGTLHDLFALLPSSIIGNGASVQSSAPETTRMQDLTVQVEPVRCRSHGGSYLLYSIAEWLGVTELMDTAFTAKTANSIKRSTSLLLGAIQRACKPGSKSQFSEWFEHTSLPDQLGVNPNVFSSQHFWEQMDGISAEEIKSFETKLFRKIVAQFPELQEKMDCLSSDFTNYYTYISNENYRCTIAQLGHSKEGRSGQKIISVAVVISPLLGIPIATMVYNGNYNDKTALKDFLGELCTRLQDVVTLKEVTFVFDGGGASEEALGLVPGHFITRGSMKTSPELYDIGFDNYEEISLQGGKVIKACRTTAVQYGKNRTVVISLSDELQRGQVHELEKRIKKFESQIAELNERIKRPRSTTDKRLPEMEERVNGLLLKEYHFADFIKITYSTTEEHDPLLLRRFRQEKKKWNKKDEPFVFETNGTFFHKEDEIPLVPIVTDISYTIDEKNKQAMIERYYGKHLLVTDQDKWSTEKILTVYRDQECIEHFFRDSKDVSNFSVRPTYHWTDDKLRVHVMICYLGLTLCRVSQYMLKRIESYDITCETLMKRLEHVQECIVFASVNGETIKPIHTMSEMNENEKETWDVVTSLIDYTKDNPAVPIKNE